jgi:hypothetical protein
MLPLLIVASITLVWLAQPWVMYYMVLPCSRTSIFVTVLVFATITAYLGSQLHKSLEDITIKPLCFILLWYPVAMQFMRYLHAWSVGGKVFQSHFGLTEFDRVRIFMLCPCTVQFQTKIYDDNKPRATTTDHLKKDIKIAFMDIFITVGGCGLILLLGLDTLLPELLQRVVRVYIMGFSTSILKVVLECPCRWLLRNDGRIIRILPIYDRPHLTLCPRGLWHRWSVTAGYHLRKGFYEPLGGGCNDTTSAQKYFATAVPFGVNCLLHVTWWSIAIKGEIDFVYWNLLFAYPLVSFWVQDAVVGDLVFGTRKPQSIGHHMANLAILWIGFCAVSEPMSSAHGLNHVLTDVCRANVFLPPLER